MPLTSDVSALRNQVGKVALGLVSSLLLALLSWGGVQLWGSKLSVEDYHTHLAKEALSRQLDSIHFVRQDRATREVLCAVKPKDSRCARKR
jgi:hypothetical protein